MQTKIKLEVDNKEKLVKKNENKPRAMLVTKLMTKEK